MIQSQRQHVSAIPRPFCLSEKDFQESVRLRRSPTETAICNHVSPPAAFIKKYFSRWPQSAKNLVVRDTQILTTSDWVSLLLAPGATACECYDTEVQKCTNVCLGGIGCNKDCCEAYTKHPEAAETLPIYATGKRRGWAGKSAKQ